jgi:hypothetical protein
MTQKVARDLITVVQMVPRLALQATPRQLKELEVSLTLCSHIWPDGVVSCCIE